jgi:hypothetical protein
MVELARRISGDWIELRETLNDLSACIEQLAVTATELRDEAQRLRLSVEQGILDYKRGRLAPVLSGLETARFRTISQEEMAAHERGLAIMLLTVLVQRLIALDMLTPTQSPGGKPAVHVEGIPVDAILADLKARVKANPELRARSAVQNILVQVKLYNRENRTMRQLLPTIRPEMRTAFLGNFTRTFTQIIASIRRQYLALLEEQAASERAGHPAFALGLVGLKPLAPLLVNQARELARMRSTLGYARGDKYKTREVLVALYEGRHDALRLIEEERAMCGAICAAAPQFGAEACLLGVVNGFRDEIIRIYERQLRRDEG